MSKRLQVLLEEEELREIQRIARSQRTTVAEWVRQALRAAARRRAADADSGKKLAVIRSASRHTFPVSDVEGILSEIERGYLGPVAP